MGVEILGAGHHFPGQLITNAKYIEEYAPIKDSGVPLTADDIVKVSGIEERYIADESTKLSDIASAAGRVAINRAGYEDPRQAGIDQILVATSTPDESFPNTASMVAEELEIDGEVSCTDINAACAGFAKILALAGINTDGKTFNRSLLIGADIFSRITNYNDYKTGTLFGDGAGAVLLGYTPEDRGIIGTASDTLPRHDVLYSGPQGTGAGFLHMNGPEVYRVVRDYLPKNIQNALSKCGLGFDDVDRYIFHQANGKMLEAFARNNGIDPDKVPILGLQRSGNTSAATIPIAQSLEFPDRPPKHGEVYVYSGFGAGMVIETVVMKM